MFTFGTAPSPGAFNLTVACGGNPSESDLKTCFECTQTYKISPAGLQPNPLPAGANCAQRTTCAGTQVGSAPGNKLNKNVADVINTYLNSQVVLIPMYDTTPTGSGGSTITYTIAGFAELLMDSPAATGGNGSNPVVLHGIFQKVVAPHAAQGTCQGTGLNLGATTFYLAR